MDIPSRGFPRGAVRVSDAERDAAVAELSQHYQVGRLTAEEFSDRSAQAFAAKTGDQLHALFDDLPPVTTWPPSGQAVPVRPAAPLDARPPRRLGPGRTVAVCIIGYMLAGDIVSALVNAASHDWSDALGAMVPALVFGVIILALLRPLLQPRRR